MASRLPKLLRGPRRWTLGRLLAWGLGQAGAAVATALLVEAAFRALGTGSAPSPALLAGLTAAAAVLAGLRYLEQVDAERLGQDYVVELRAQLYRKVLRLDPRTMQRRSKGGMTLRLLGDLTALRQWISLGVARLLVGGTMAIGALVGLAWMNLPLAGALAALLGFSALASMKLGGGLRRATGDLRNRRARLGTEVTEKLNAVSVVQAFGQWRREERRMGARSAEVAAASVARARWIGALRAAAEAGAALALMLVLAVGGLQVSQGGIDAATVASLMAMAGLLAGRIRELSRVYEYRQGARVAGERLEEVLALPARNPRHGRPLPDGNGHLRLEGVQLPGTPGQLDAEVVPGSVIAVVGSNGAGKSTLLHAIAGLVPAESGRLLLDGQDLARCRGLDRSRAISLLSPDLPLLRGSVARNLCYRAPRVSERARQRIRHLTGLYELIERLPEGARTSLRERGLNLSPGERQRLALARALLGGPRLLLLDEPEANLDGEAAGVVSRVLEARLATTLFVTHRPEHLRLADEVWYLEEGRIAERGAPADVLRRDGPTARLFGLDGPRVVTFRGAATPAQLERDSEHRY